YRIAAAQNARRRGETAMNRRIAITGPVLLLAIAAAHSQSAGSRDADIQALKDNETQWNKDWAAKDPGKIAAHYSADAVLMAPGMAAINGQDAIAAALKQMLSDSGLSLHFEASHVDVASSGDLAFTQGSYTMTMTDPASKKPVNDKGSYITVYRKIGG